jgi:4-hydroxybenzoate polyprenyltransferase
VLVGYLAVSFPDLEGPELFGLMISSALFYISGIVFNDFFDVEHDRVTRPARPLPSGAITRTRAATVAVVAIAAANVIALVSAGIFAIVVSLPLSAIIVAYDWRLKSSAIAGAIAMAFSRFLNVMLGASPAIAGLWFVLAEGEIDVSTQTLALAAASLFFYTVSIMILSRVEVDGASRTRYLASVALVYAIIVIVGIEGSFIGWDLWYLPVLAAFAGVLSFTFLSNYRSGTAASAQRTIRNMVLCIILLDAIFVTGIAGMVYGTAALLLLIPAVVLSRKIHVT